MNIKHLAQEWIKAEESDENSSDQNHWAVDSVIDLPLERKYDELWRFIKYVHAQNPSNKVVEVLAAGPLEDLLAGSGDTYIDEIATLARKDPSFKNVLGGVWQNSMSESLWTKVKDIRGTAKC
jgi:Family of unknown function (DUF6869)